VAKLRRALLTDMSELTVPVRPRHHRGERRRPAPRPARGPQGGPGEYRGKAGHGLWFNDHIEEDGETVFQHACKLGLEDIVSKRKGSPYRSGHSPDWLKMKNPNALAVKREEEEDWGR
jgi:hypothetical protein